VIDEEITIFPQAIPPLCQLGEPQAGVNVVSSSAF
jgi:hypothetical protein